MVLLLAPIGMILFVIWIIFIMKDDCPTCKEKNTVVRDSMMNSEKNIYKCKKCGNEFIIH